MPDCQAMHLQNPAEDSGYGIKEWMRVYKRSAKVRQGELHLEDVVSLRIGLKQRTPGSKVGQHRSALRLLQGLPVRQQHAKSGQDLHTVPKASQCHATASCNQITKTPNAAGSDAA